MKDVLKLIGFVLLFGTLAIGGCWARVQFNLWMYPGLRGPVASESTTDE